MSRRAALGVVVALGVVACSVLPSPEPPRDDQRQCDPGSILWGTP